MGADEAAGQTEGEHEVSWQLAKTDYGSVFVKADEKERITYIAAYLRPGKEMPFEKIGQLEKAPVLTDRVVAWDVVRPNRPLIGVVARGSERKANSITMFIVNDRAPISWGWLRKKGRVQVGRLTGVPVVQLTDGNVSIHPLF